MLEEHQARIDRLTGIDHAEIQRKRIASLVDGVKNGDLTVEDVTTYTNITPEQLMEMMEERRDIFS